MKKIVLFIFSALLASNIAYAEELVVQLTSGNSVIIEYTGTIESVAMIGDTDAIKTMNFKKASKKSAQQIAAQPKTPATPPETTKVKNKENGWIRMRMAEPLSED